MRLTSGKDAVGCGPVTTLWDGKSSSTDHLFGVRDHVNGSRLTVGLPRDICKSAPRRRLPIPWPLSSAHEPRCHTIASGWLRTAAIEPLSSQGQPLRRSSHGLGGRSELTSARKKFLVNVAEAPRNAWKHASFEPQNGATQKVARKSSGVPAPRVHAGPPTTSETRSKLPSVSRLFALRERVNDCSPWSSFQRNEKNGREDVR